MVLGGPSCLLLPPLPASSQPNAGLLYLLFHCNWNSPDQPAIMFRRLSHTLPQEPVFPTALRQLGYFLNDHDQIRQIRNPEQKYQFKANVNDRVNEVYKDSMNSMLSPLPTESINKSLPSSQFAPRTWSMKDCGILGLRLFDFLWGLVQPTTMSLSTSRRASDRRRGSSCSSQNVSLTH